MVKPRGRHPHNALNAAAIRNQKRPGKYADGNGLYLIVDQSGNKRWILRITVRGKRRDIGLGGWPAISLANARTSALDMRRIAKSGGNPLAERRKSLRKIPTFGEAAEAVHAAHKSSWKNAKHQAQWINTLRTYAFPFFGDLRIDLVTSAEVVEALTPIWLEKPETAKRVRQRIGAVLDWAKANGYRDAENPISSVLRALPKPSKAINHHASMPYQGLPEFLIDLRESNSSISSRLALEFLILTATRTGEVLRAEWTEIDLQGKEWTIPAARMKAGKDFRVPLSDRAVSILEEAKTLGSSRFVFPGQRSNKPLSQMALLMLLRRLGADVTTHGFRSTFRNWSAEQTNFPREICESALAHTVKSKTEAAYLRTDQFAKRRKLMDAWERYATTPKKAEVIHIRTSA